MKYIDPSIEVYDIQEEINIITNSSDPTVKDVTTGDGEGDLP